MKSALLAATLAALPAFAAAQTSAQPAAARGSEATMPTAPVPTAIRDYRRYEDVKLESWRAANDAAAALGGHVGQVRGGRASPREGQPPHHRHDRRSRP